MLKPVGRQLAFCQAYVSDPDLNATRAMIKAGYSPKTATNAGYLMLLKPHIAAEIKRLMKGRAKRAEISADAVLNMWWETATIDRTDIVNLVRVNCRYCNGTDHKYQYKHSEFLAEQHRLKGKKVDIRGGANFNEMADPNPECPECFGNGIERIASMDTRLIPEQHRKLITGMKNGKDGLVITMRDPEKALESVARHLGMFVEKIDLNVKFGMADRLAKARARVNKRKHDE